VTVIGWVSVLAARPRRAGTGQYRLRVLGGSPAPTLQVRLTEEQFSIAAGAIAEDLAPGVSGRQEKEGSQHWLCDAEELTVLELPTWTKGRRGAEHPPDVGRRLLVDDGQGRPVLLPDLGGRRGAGNSPAVPGGRAYAHGVVEIGSRRRGQPPPPHVVFEALTEPNRDPARPWLILLKDEQWPRILAATPPSTVLWSSLWRKRPDATIRFDLADSPGGTDLRWTLDVDEPVPDPSLVGHMRKRLNELINANLRYTFGQ
jgi:hypothetical protein